MTLDPIFEALEERSGRPTPDMLMRLAELAFGPPDFFDVEQQAKMRVILRRYLASLIELSEPAFRAAAGFTLMSLPVPGCLCHGCIGAWVGRYMAKAMERDSGRGRSERRCLSAARRSWPIGWSRRRWSRRRR